MKNYYSFLFLFLLSFVSMMIACTGNQVEPQVDCNLEGPTIATTATASACESPTGTITVNVTGGTGPFSYSIASAGMQNTTGQFQSLMAGNYDVTVTDANNCTASSQVTVGSLDGPGIDAVSLTVSGCGTTNGTLTVAASGGAGGFQYSLDGGTPQSDSTFTGLAAGTYELSVEDTNGCGSVQQVQILTGISLADDVAPIIQTNCALASCHGGTQSPDLSTSAGIIASADRIRARTSAGTMPPTGALPQAMVEAIACWVGDGAPDN